MTPRRRARARPGAPDPRHARGAAGEALARRHLEAQGFRCLAQDLRTRLGEIDLLLRRGSLLVGVEVNTRTHHPAPELLVDDERLARYRRVLLALAPTLEPRPRTLRVDRIAVRLRGAGGIELLHAPGIPFAAGSPGN